MTTMTLVEWQATIKPHNEYLYNCSEYTHQNDEWNPFPIGMSWQLINYKGEYSKLQIGDHYKLVLCAVNSHTDRRRRPIGGRDSILKMLARNGISNTKLSSSEYLTSLPSYKFIISPEGNGIDCHRHYEALMAGCIPIVEEYTGIREKYGNAPILYTKDYSEITPEYLSAQYEIIKNVVYDFSKLLLSTYDIATQTVIKQNGNYWGKRLANKVWY